MRSQLILVVYCLDKVCNDKGFCSVFHPSESNTLDYNTVQLPGVEKEMDTCLAYGVLKRQ